MARKGVDLESMYLTEDVLEAWETVQKMEKFRRFSKSEILKTLVKKAANLDELAIELNDVNQQRLVRVRDYYQTREGSGVIVSYAYTLEKTLEEKDQEVATRETNQTRLKQVYEVLYNQMVAMTFQGEEFKALREEFAVLKDAMIRALSIVSNYEGD